MDYQSNIRKGDNAKSKKGRVVILVRDMLYGHSCTQHIVWSCSTFLISIIKIFQRVFDLQSGHEINGKSPSDITKGDNTKSKKGRVVILVRDMLSGPVLHFYQVPQKYSKGSLTYKADRKSMDYHCQI